MRLPPPPRPLAGLGSELGVRALLGPAPPTLADPGGPGDGPPRPLPGPSVEAPPPVRPVPGAPLAALEAREPARGRGGKESPEAATALAGEAPRLAREELLCLACACETSGSGALVMENKFDGLRLAGTLLCSSICFKRCIFGSIEAFISAGRDFMQEEGSSLALLNCFSIFCRRSRKTSSNSPSESSS